MNKNIKAVIFDMDGILIDSESICDQIWYRLAEQMNLSNIQDAIQENRGCNEKQMAQNLCNRYGKDFNCPKFFSDFSEYFHEIEFSKGIDLLPDVKETLDYLKSKDYKLGLATSTRRQTATRQLTNCKIFDYFSAATFGDEVTCSKPHPEIYLSVANKLGVAPCECVGVEDSPNGIKSCHAAGFKSVMVPDRIEPTEEIIKLCWKVGKPISILKEYL